MKAAISLAKVSTLHKAMTLMRIFAIYVRQAFYHRTDAMISVLAWSLRMGVVIVLYAAIYDLMGRDRIMNITFAVAASGMVLNTIINGFSTREVSFAINAENKSGLLEMWVNKPISYVGLKAVEVLGRSIPAVMGLCLVAIVFWSIRNHFPPVDHLGWRILAAIALLVPGIILGTILFAMAGLTSVYLQDSRPVNQLVEKFTLMFGGAYIPIGFFPGWFRTFGESLPTTASVYVTQMFYPDFLHNLPRFFATQIIWLVVAYTLLQRLNRSVTRRLTVNGG